MVAVKYDTGKPAMHLIPWDAINVIDRAVSVEDAAYALTRWWYIRPRPLEMAIPRPVLREVAAVLAFGAEKYSARNWEQGIAFSRLFAAAMRHADSVARGESNDPESGLPHAAHFWCCVVFIVTLTAREAANLDDRPAASPQLLEMYDSMASVFAAFSGAAQPRPEPPQGEQN
jgi:hypothetical protein